MKTLMICLSLLCVGGLSSAKGEEKPLRLVPYYNPFFVQVGAPFSVSCIKEASSPIHLIWYLDGQDPRLYGFDIKEEQENLDNGMVRTTSYLSKDSVSLEDMGGYGIMCETDVPNEQKQDVTISAFCFNVQTEHPNVTEGEDISLKCAPDTAATIIWLRDGQVIDNSTSNRLIQDDNRTLIIQNSRLQDSGIYQCKMLIQTGLDKNSNELKEQIYIQNISVAGKPYLQEKLATNIDTLVNDTLTLNCPVTGYPVPEAFWLREDDSPVQESSRVTFDEYNDVSDAVLMISKVTKEDLGVYRCVAKNSIGQMSKEFHVGLAGGVASEHANAGFPGVFIMLFTAFVLTMFE